MSAIVRSVAASLFNVPWDRRLAFFHDQSRHLSAHRRDDARLCQPAARVPQRRGRLCDRMRRGLGARFANLDLRSQLLHLLVGDQRRVGTLEVGHALIVALRLAEARPRLPQVGLAARHRGGRALGLGYVVGRVDLEQELALGHAVALAHRKPDDPARDVGAEVYLGPRLDLSARGYRGDQIAPLHRLDAHFRRLVTAGDGGNPGYRDDHDGGAGEQGPFLLLGHVSLRQRRGRPTALSSAAKAL